MIQKVLIILNMIVLDIVVGCAGTPYNRAKDITPPPDDVLHEKVLEVGRAMGLPPPYYANQTEGLVVWRIMIKVPGPSPASPVCDGLFAWHIKRVSNRIGLNDPLLLYPCQPAIKVGLPPNEMKRLQQLLLIEANCLQEEFKRRWLALVGPMTFVGPTEATHPLKELYIDVFARFVKERSDGQAKGSSANAKQAAQLIEGSFRKFEPAQGSSTSASPTFPQSASPEGPHARAQRLLYSGQIARAVAVWEEALRGDPNNQDMLMGLGTTLYAEGQYARAVPYLRRAVALTEDDWTLRLFTASVLYLAGEEDQSRVEFEAIVKHAPNRGTAQIASDKIDGEYFRAQRALEKAGGAARELGQLWLGQFIQIPWAPRQPDLFDDGSLGPILSALVRGGGIVVKEGSVATGGDYVGQYGDVRFEAVAYAKNRYLVTIRAWKGSPEEQNWRSLVTRLGYFEFFLDTVRAGGGASASEVAVVKQKLQASFAVQQGKFAEAAEAIKAALASAPDDPQALSVRGMLSASAGQLDTALKAYNAALDHWSDYAAAHYGVGAIDMLQRRYQDAVTALITAVALEPTMWEGYLYLASAYCHLGKRAEASAALVQAGEAAPDMGIPDQLQP